MNDNQWDLVITLVTVLVEKPSIWSATMVTVTDHPLNGMITPKCNNCPQACQKYKGNPWGVFLPASLAWIILGVEISTPCCAIQWHERMPELPIEGSYWRNMSHLYSAVPAAVGPPSRGSSLEISCFSCFSSANFPEKLRIRKRSSQTVKQSNHHQKSSWYQ